MKKSVLILFLGLFQLFCFSQEGEVIDGIKAKLKSHKTKDSVKVDLIVDLAWEYSYFNFDTTLILCEQAIGLSKEIDYQSGMASALSIKGNTYRALGKYDSAHYFLNLALHIRQAQNRPERVAAVLSNIANIYNYERKYADAITIYKQTIPMFEEAGNYNNALIGINNLASMYSIIHMPKKAAELLNKAFELNKKLKDEKQDAMLYGTMAALQSDIGNYDAAIKYARVAIELSRRYKDLQTEAAMTNNLGIYYRHKNDLAQSLIAYERALVLNTQIGDTTSFALLYNNLATVYLDKKQINKAIANSQKALGLAKHFGDTILMYKSMLVLMRAYTEKHDFKQALEYGNAAKPLIMADNIKEEIKNMYNDFAALSLASKDYKAASEYLQKTMEYTDSVNAENNANLIANLGVEMELNSKENQIELLNKTAQIKEIELKRKTHLQWFFSGIAFLFALIGVLMLFSYRRIKKANAIINEQKQSLQIQNVEINEQKLLVEEKNKEITDSITYAKRLQQAILPPSEYINNFISENFILYKPKDIVAGDFYWAYSTNSQQNVAGSLPTNNSQLFFLAAADSTGHGVPGAMVSVVCSNALNRAVKEFNLAEPGKILDKTRELVLETFEKSTGEIKDGMDISLLCIEFPSPLERDGKVRLSWSGANNPLWYIQNNILHEIKPDKQPIGKTDNPQPFTTHTIELSPFGGVGGGCTFYLITDGFADQFGGKTGKKFMSKNFRELLASNAHLPMEEQKQSLEKSLQDWQGSIEQVDDITVIGIKI